MTGHAEGPAPERRDKLRQRIAAEAARGVAAGSDAKRAVFRAARRVARGWVPDDRLPGPDEVRGEVQQRLDPRAALSHLAGDRFDRIAALVGMLATVRQDRAAHPEGDALEHALQVFDLVHGERPFDEELLTAALVHDVGRAIDRTNPVASCVSVLGDLITERTRWLVESLEVAAAHGNHTLGARARQRLESHPDFLDVLLLAECDRKACIRGYDAVSLDEAIAILRRLALENDADEAADEAADE
jgi:predicted HD phosphohydrolase